MRPEGPDDASPDQAVREPNTTAPVYTTTHHVPAWKYLRAGSTGDAHFGTPSETFSARRDRIRRSSGASAADTHFDAGDFGRAAAAYQSAFDAERDSLRDGAAVSMMYNAALSLLGNREYERALEAASTAHSLGSNRSVRDLVAELRQRLTDRETFASIGVAPPE